MANRLIVIFIMICTTLQVTIAQNSGTVIDTDGNSYPTVKIGDKIWMAENLRTTKDRDGQAIQQLNLDQNVSSLGMYWHGNDPTSANSKLYGPVYNWTAVKNSAVCPVGWRIPTQDDWNLVIRAWYGKDAPGIGRIQAGAPGLTYAAYQLREAGNKWPSNDKATNSTGFSALPGGWLWGGSFRWVGSRSAWWGPVNGGRTPGFTKIAKGDNGTWTGEASTVDNLYVRCVQDAPIEYTVEMLGRQGKLQFDAPLSEEPTGGILTLFKGTPASKTTYRIENGSWESGIFSGKIMDSSNPAVAANLPGASRNGIKLKPVDGTLAFIGAIGYENHDTWMSGNHLLLGYDSDHEIIFKKDNASLFTLVVNDKHADKKWDSENKKYLNKYSYGWWVEPSVAITDNFRMVHLVNDELLEEVALYAFDNSSSNRQNNLSKYKVLAYPMSEIIGGIEEIFGESNAWSRKTDITSDLGALMINKAQLLYPSRKLGFKSSGHGSPTGIMNGFFPEARNIKEALSWVKEIKGSNVDFLDFATNCNVASLYNLASAAPYVDYVVASDLTRSSPLPISLYNERPEGATYNEYFENESKSTSQIMGEIVDKYGELFNSQAAIDWAKSDNATAKGRTLSSWRQQLVLFDMSKMRLILENIGGEEAYKTIREKAKAKEAALSSFVFSDGSAKYYSFKQAIPVLYPEYTNFERDWTSMVLKQMSNREQFQWEESQIPTGLILSRK